jgi:hypothetical protein
MATHDLDLVRRSNSRTIELNPGRLDFDSADTPVSSAAGALSVDSVDTPHESQESV